MTRIRRLLGDLRGATSIEYAVIASMLSILIIGGAGVIGSKVSQRFAAVAGNIN